ncbi:MAG: plastocyanin/azurin family copper-binding protein [Candidatus Nanosalina sp.]
MRKIVLAALFAAVVAVSGCTSTTQPQAPEDTGTDTQPTNDNRTTYTVYYTSSGFQPSELTIQQGETVVWVNNASRSMWVASAMHPTHTQYAGTSLAEHCNNGDQNTAAFDQCSSGDRFSFTFEKTGTWSYHNHEFAAHTGSVTVVG